MTIALRALVPQGMMATPDALHGVAVLMCDGTGVAGRMELPLSEKHEKAKHNAPCPFGVLAQAASGTPDAWAIAPVLRQAVGPQPTPAGFNLVVASHLLPPARGPPNAV
jgi:hypothetical protein